MSDAQRPIACDPSAIDAEEHDAHRQTAEAVFEAVVGVREVDDGYAFRLPAETEIIAQAGAFIARERLCCPFFHFTLEVPPAHSPVWLTLTGRSGVKAYVEDAVLPYWDLDDASQPGS